MDPGVKVYFCEFCNQSVPQKDLDAGAARIHLDRVIGACCVPTMFPGAAGVPPRQGDTGGLLTLGAVCLIAIAGAASYLDWRLGRSLDSQGRQLTSQAGELRSQSEAVRALATRVEEGARKSDLDGVSGGMTQRLEPLVQTVRAFDERLGARATEEQRARDDLRTLTQSVVSRQAQLDETLARVAAQVERLGGELEKAARAAPAMPANPQPATPPEERSRPTPENAAGDAGSQELPKNLQHFVKQLADPDAGTRWNAVDALAKTGDARVVKHLLPVLKDADAFVRRFCAGSLGELKAKDAVAPLVDLLSDTELIVREAAQRSLKKITGQSIEFDAEAPIARRNDAIQKWRDWLKSQGGPGK